MPPRAPSASTIPASLSSPSSSPSSPFRSRSGGAHYSDSPSIPAQQGVTGNAAFRRISVEPCEQPVSTVRLYQETAYEEEGVGNNMSANVYDEKRHVTSLTEKEDDFDTTYDYRGYGGAGEYVQVPNASIMERLGHQSRTAAVIGGFGATEMRPTRPDQTNEGGRKSTKRIGEWLASQYLFRQAVYMSTGCLLLWIPGLVALTFYGASSGNKYNRPTVLSVGLVWWSIWLSSAWVGIWVCFIIATVIPIVLRRCLGVLSVALKRYISYAEATRSYIALLLWTLILWIIFLLTVWSQLPGHDDVDSSQVDPLAASNSTTNANTTITTPSTPSISTLLPRGPPSTGNIIQNPSISTAQLESDAARLVSLSRLLFGLVICSAILLAEKVLMQSIALSFHQTTYSDRVKESEYHIGILTSLLSFTKGTFLSATNNFLTQPNSAGATQKKSPCPCSITIRAQKFRLAEASKAKRNKPTTLPINNRRAILDLPNSPFTLRAHVETSLENEAMSRNLARQIFAAFAQPCKNTSPGEDVLREADIRKCFKTSTEAHHAFTVLDRDNNEGCTWSEFQSSVLEMHKERVCLLASLHDVDSAVLKLDNFFMSFYLLVSCVIIAALMSTKFSTLLVSLGTILLGLSWLVGNSAQESLTSIVWVFGKHPIDVGDAVQIPGLLVASSSSTNGTTPEDVFIVEEIQLLSTVLKTMTGKMVLVSNFQLAQKPIVNYRRSGPMDEMFTVTVEYATSFEQIEKLREKMVDWIRTQGRDFLPGLDIELNPLSDLSMISLTMDIRYKSNWQDDYTKARRRNAWMAALKTFMDQLDIYGPAGRPRGNDEDPAKVKKKDRTGGTIPQYAFMDSRDSYEEVPFSSSPPPTARDTQEHSRLNEAMPSAPRQHSVPTTQLAGLNVRGRRGGDEHVGDLEKGSP